MASCPKQPFFTPLITLYDYLTGSGPFDFPYMNPKSTPQCPVTGFGFGNVSGLNCTHFENPINEVRYAGKLLTWLFTSKSDNYAIQNILKAIFPWDEGPKGPSASNLTCFLINIGSIFSMIILLIISIIFIYVVFNALNSFQKKHEIFKMKQKIDDQDKRLAALENNKKDN